MPRLNPQVNIKNIVIGLMDRLSAYATREREHSSVDHGLRPSDEAAEVLMSKLHLSSDDKDLLEAKEENSHENRKVVVDPDQTPMPEEAFGNKIPKDQGKKINHADTAGKPFIGISDDVKLFETFYEQVSSLIKAQRLAVSDTMALLVSLINLAM